MNLSDAKQEVADTLNDAGIKAHAHDIKKQGENLVIVEPGSPYVEPGTTFGSNTIRFDLAVIGKPITANGCWDLLDNLINAVVLALWDSVDVESISQPGTLTWGAKTLVAATVTVTANINFKEVI